MKILIALLALAIVLIATSAFADQEYNPMSRSWETVPSGAIESGWTTQMNPMTNQWSIQPSDAQIEYNPFSKSWDWSSGHGNKGE